MLGRKIAEHGENYAEKVVLETPPWSALIPLRKGPAVLGLSRSHIYRAARAGKIELVKTGSTTAVVAASAAEYLASLPRFVPGTAARRRKGSEPS